MVRMSALRNVPVICHSRQIGLLQSISLDAARKRVHALVVSCGMRGKRVVLGQHVQAIADGFILADQDEKYKAEQHIFKKRVPYFSVILSGAKNPVF